MDIRNALYPLPNKNSALSWELFDLLQLSRYQGCDRSIEGLKQPVSVQSQSHPRAGAGLCWCLSPGRKTAALVMPCQVQAGFACNLLGFIQLIPYAGVTAAVAETLKLIKHCACRVRCLCL